MLFDTEKRRSTDDDSETEESDDIDIDDLDLGDDEKTKKKIHLMKVILMMI